MSEQTSSDSGARERSPWSRPSVLVSACFLLALILAGLLVLFVGGSPHPVAPVSPPAGRGPSSSSPVAASANGCTLRPGDQAVPEAAPPPGATWGQVGSMQTPQAPGTLGPQRASGGWNTCFSHCPSGALLAAMNLWAEGTAADPSAVFAHLAVGAPADLGNGDRLDAGGPVQFAGYRFESYDPTTARILVVIRGAQGKLAAAATTMRWVGGDWKYAFPAGGGLSIAVIADLSGYVQWSAF